MRINSYSGFNSRNPQEALAQIFVHSQASLRLVIGELGQGFRHEAQYIVLPVPHTFEQVMGSRLFGIPLGSGHSAFYLGVQDDLLYPHPPQIMPILRVVPRLVRDNIWSRLSLSCPPRPLYPGWLPTRRFAALLGYRFPGRFTYRLSGLEELRLFCANWSRNSLFSLRRRLLSSCNSRQNVINSSTRIRLSALRFGDSPSTFRSISSNFIP